MRSEAAASALRWWEEAGVDILVDETPRNWLAPERVAPEAAAAREALPDDLVEFQAWLRASQTLPYAAPSAPRLGPSGDPSTGLMVMVDMPAPEDLAAGTLLAGEAGALFDRMLAAIELSRDLLYLAPLSPVRTASGMLDAAGAKALAEIARHHVALAKPRALLLFGDACAKALIGLSVSGARGRWHQLETKAGKIDTLVTIRPAKLVAMPGLKKLAWEDLQMLKEGPRP